MSNYVSALNSSLNASARFLDQRPGLAMRVLRYAVLALRIRAERRRLATLSDAQLADMGISRGAAEREAARPLLDVPAHRKSTLYL